MTSLSQVDAARQAIEASARPIRSRHAVGLFVCRATPAKQQGDGRIVAETPD